MMDRLALVSRLAAPAAMVASLVACDPPPPSDAGIDAPLDGGALDEDGGTGIDSSEPGPGLAAQRRALAGYVETFCACLPMRNPEITEAECLAASAPDGPVLGCEDEATAAVGSAFDGYYRCRASAFEALDACAAGECSDASVMACGGEFQRAVTRCQSVLPDVSVVQAYLDVYQACIVTDVTGAGSCPDDPDTVTSAVGDAVITGTTALGGNDSEPGAACFPDAMSMMDAVGAPDRSYRWAAPAAGSYRFDTIGSAFDTILYLRSACDDTADLSCSDDIVLGVERTSCVAVDLADGEEIVIVVDGFGDLTRGEFVINVTDDAACPVADEDAGVAPDAGVDSGYDAG